MISRDELYRLVWAEPMTKVAERLGVSGSYLARVCMALNVPRPAPGYWAKLIVQKAPAPETLPDARPGDQLHWSKNEGLVAVPKLPAFKPATDRRPHVRRTGTHPLITGAKAHFENSRSIDEGAYLRPYKRLLVDVTSSEAGLDRALELANDLFNAFLSLGHRAMLAPPSGLRRATIDERERQSKPRDPYYHRGPSSPDRPTVVYIGPVAVGLAIVEMSEDVLLRYVRGKYIRDADYVAPRMPRYGVDQTWTTTKELPSGRFRVIAYSPHAGVT